MNSSVTQVGLPPALLENPDAPEIGAAEALVQAGVFLMTNSFERGGSERQFVELARALNPATYSVQVGCCQPKGVLREEIGTVHHFGLGGSLYRLSSMRSRYRLARHLRRTAVAVAHSFDYYTNLMLIPAARLAGTPVVIGSQRQLGDLLTPAQRRAQLAMFRLSDCVICNSKAAADGLINQGLRAERLRVIGNGLAPAAFADTKPAIPRRAGVFRVGMIARMNTRSKNHRMLLEAAVRVRERLQGLEVVFVGDGPLRPELEQAAEELGIGGSVQFLGDRHDIPAILASLDVTVLPSSSESLSNAILESMAAGIPVIANRVGGNSELIDEDRGVLLQPHDVEAMEAALVRIAADAPLREMLGRNAKRFALENFTIEQMRNNHEQLYAELLEKKGWRARPSSIRAAQAASRVPLRVTIVAASLRYVGGQSVQADMLLKHWHNDSELQAELVPIDSRLPAGLTWVEKVPGLRTLVRAPFYFAALWCGMKDADIAHIFSASYWSFLVSPVPAWLVARARKKKVLLHYHSGEARDHLQRFRTARPLLARMGLLVVPSQYLVDVFREFGLKAEVVPNIVDLSQFRFRSRAPLRPHLVCTRGFHPYYRVDLVVRAFAEVQKTFPEARLDLAGGGPEEQKIRSLVLQLKLVGVSFLGVVPHASIGKVYDDADIFVNASSLDNMPVSVLEGFASGTPVVSTAPEGMSYLVDHGRTGLLSPVGDAAALAENILRLLKDSNLSSRLAASAYEECNRYNWTTVREQWLSAYRALMSDSKTDMNQMRT